MLEEEFRLRFIKRLEKEFPGCFVLKNDPKKRQGTPDLVLLYYGWWAALELKRAGSASRRPNQGYYISLLDELSFAAFVYPENEEEVVYALQQSFAASR